MEEALAKIRPHTSSSLSHQRAPAVLLIALESAFKEQHADPSPTAYFAALLTTVEETVQRQKQGSSEEDEVLHAGLYLLALVAPYVPTPVVRSNLNIVLDLTAPLFHSFKEQAPALRSQLSLYHIVYKSLDRHQLETPGIRQTFASVLNLCIDSRPKVRKKAADIIKDILATPPTPLARHPYSERVSSWIESTLSGVTVGPLAKHKGNGPSPNPDTALHVVAFLRPVIAHLSPSSIPAITKLLLILPQLGNPYLSQSVYSVLSDIFLHSLEDGIHVHDALPDILHVVLSSPPSKSDIILSPAWVELVASAFAVYRAPDDVTHANELGDAWKAVWGFLESNNAVTRKAAAESLNVLCGCFSPALISSALKDEHSESTLRQIISKITKALESLTYARAIPELLSVASSIVLHLRYRPSSRATPTAAETLFLPFIERIGNLRMHKGFEHKEAVDSTLSAAMEVLGPQVILRVLPLNLEPPDRLAGREPRAFLLSLLPRPHPSPLSHFISYFVPLSERMFDLKSTAEVENRPSEAKVWSVLVAQIWSGLVGYCHGTFDLKESLSPSFAQLLSQLLYGYPELRPAILRALKVMVESNVDLAAQDREAPSSDSITSRQAQENLEILRSQAESWLAVLFNVFDSASRDSRGMVGDVISAWASIAGDQEITRASGKVLDLFKSSMNSATKAPPSGGGPSNANSTTSTAQDLIIVLLPHLSTSDASTLFDFCLSPDVLCWKDNGVQKRGYKILAKLVGGGKVETNAESTIHRLDELSDGLLAAAKKDRFNLLTLLVPSIPPSAMHVIPSLIPEAVLGTKEPSEKARSAAFDLVVAMGKKMNEGGVVKRSLVDGMDEDSPVDTAANLEEFLTMVAGGLAASAHMISATITAISRLIFEFKDVISEKMQTEIFTTLLVFLSSANREIVKSILGFVKLSIHTLPTHIVRPYLKDLVTGLLAWSHDHKNHFKAKVRHIFERMLRRFSWDEIYACAGDEEAAKVLVNIKKRKERAKRKKEGRSEHDDDHKTHIAKPSTGDTFEDVLYGSEDDSDDSEYSAPAPSNNKRARQQQKRSGYGAQLRMDDDEPTDLLSGAASKIMSSKAGRRHKAGPDAPQFKTDDETGKMVIEESDPDDEHEPSKDVAGLAYRESMASEDGFTRGRNGQIKFNKNTKKRRQEAGQIEDVEMADGENVSLTPQKKKSRSERSLGHEFKAKKAGGDVKRKGVDPYAYVPLSQAAKKGQRNNNTLGIAKKR